MTETTDLAPSGTDVATSDALVIPDLTAGGAVVTAPQGHPHPAPRQYVLIAVVLVVITGFEVATSYLEGDVNSNLIILALGVMAALKFFLVVAWFMHLRTDSKILRRLFVLGLVAAPLVYTVMLLVLRVFAH